MENEQATSPVLLNNEQVTTAETKVIEDENLENSSSLSSSSGSSKCVTEGDDEGTFQPGSGEEIRTRPPSADSAPVLDIRASLSEEQLQALDQFRANLFELRPSVEKEYADFNDKAARKKRAPTEPPIARLWVGEFTDKQKQWLDDRCLCRYLRARDWDLEKAEHMIRCTLAWREDYKPDEITAADIELQSKTGKMYFNYEFSKTGYPIIYMKLNRDQGNDRVTKLKFMVWMLEKIISAMDTSKGIEKMLWLTDFKGTGMRMATMSHISISLDCLHTLQNHYPERLGVAFAVNPPRVFSAFWKILTPFMNEVTINKIRFVSGEKEYPVMLEHIEKELLEKQYGGDQDRDYDHKLFVTREIEGREGNGEAADSSGRSPKSEGKSRKK